MGLHTTPCDELGIEHPILSVGFGLGANAELAAAVSNAGGCGVIGTGDLFDIGWPNAPHRVIRNQVVDECESAGRPAPGHRPGEGTTIGAYRYPWGEEDTWERYQVGMLIPGFQGDVEYAPMWAGRSTGEVNDIKPAGDIVRDLVREAEQELTTL